MSAWHVNRAAGLVALILLTASVLLGLLLSSRLLGGRVKGSWLQDLHRGVSALACAFVGVHVVAALVDPWLGFGIVDVAVPGASSWRPGAVAWGIVGVYLLAAVQITSLLRRRMATTTWRYFHLLSYPLWLTAAFHSLRAGTTMGTPAGDVALGLAAAAIAGLTAVRVLEPHGRPRQEPAAPLDPPPHPPATFEPPTYAPATFEPPTFERPMPPSPPLQAEREPVRPGQPF